MKSNNSEKVEYGILIPVVKGAELTRVVPTMTRAEAVKAKQSFEGKGIEARIVKRTISPWEEIH